MPRKYKHINLPSELINAERQYDSHRGKNIPNLSRVNFQKQRINIAKNLKGLERFSKSKNKKTVFESDKNSSELKIKFYGAADTRLTDRYRIDVYKKELDSKENVTIYGKISNTPINDNVLSDFERFSEEVEKYSKTNELRSYFGRVHEIKPLNLNQIIEKSLKNEFKQNPNTEIVVDISFAQSPSLNQKLNKLEEEYQDNFLSKINTDLVHFCRVKADFNDIKSTASRYDGIVDIEHGPVYDVRTSDVDANPEDINVQPPEPNSTPLLMFDGSVNAQHFTIDNALIEQRSTRSISEHHGTAVASLLICGSSIQPGRDIKQKNRIIAFNYFDDIYTAEQRLVAAVEEFATKQQILLINLSINNYYFYRRKKIDNFTVLLDELAHKYNCLFVISAGNLFMGDYWNNVINDLCMRQGYPNYFNLDCCKILPPADSINNISVGSISYQESVNSLSKLKNPNPITRANLKTNTFVKPDFVNYDSNCVLNAGGSIQSEENGVFMAAENNNSLTRMAGTSFATPLVTHDLGILHNHYPTYRSETLKALMTHFADEVEALDIKNKTLRKQLTGFGLPNIEKALHSLNTSSCIVVEDEIGLNKQKRIRFPVPSCIAGDNKKRLRIRKTLVYTPKVDPRDPKNYNPVSILAQLVRQDDKEIGTKSTRDKIEGAHKKSNVKKYRSEEVSTRLHTGSFWYIDISSEYKGDSLQDNYIQKYSLIITLEDIKNDDSIDMHQEIQQMIEIETDIGVNIEIEN